MPQTVNVKGFGVVHFPDDFTPEQIESAIESDILPQVQSKPAPAPAPAVKPEAPNFIERVGRGSQDVVDRLAQLTVAGGEKLGAFQPGLGDVMTKQMNAEREQYAKGRNDKSIDWARLGGNVGIQAPTALIGGGVGTAARAGYGALTGALSGLMQYDETNTLAQGAKNTAIGGSTGAVLGPVVGKIGDKLGDAAEWVAGKARGMFSNSSAARVLNEVPDIANAPAEVQRDLIKEAQAQISKTGRLDAEALRRKANLVAQGVTPTKSMVTRSPADWTQERNLQKLAQSPDEQLAGVGQQLTDVYQKNDQALTSALTRLKTKSGTQEGFGMDVMKSIDDLASKSQEEVGKLYKQVELTRGADLASDAKNLFATLDDLKDSTYSDKLVTSTFNRLKRFGMIDEGGNLTSQSLTVKQAEELRKFVNKLPNDFGKRDIIKAIDQDVLGGLGDDAFKGARKAASDRFAMLDNPAMQRAVNTMGELNQGKTAQGFIKSQVIDAAEQDVKTLVAGIQKMPPQQQMQSMESMRNGVLSFLEDKAVNANSGKFSGVALAKAMDNIGEGKLKLILGGDYQKLKNVAKAGVDATFEPAYSAVNHSGTAPMLMSLLQRGRAIPGVPLFVNENAEKMAARIGYQRQLQQVMGAQAPPPPPELSPIVRDVFNLGGRSGGILAGPLLPQVAAGLLNNRSQ